MTDTTKLLDDVLKCKPLYWPTNYEKEILAALRFAKAMQPKPIEEAPRDGTIILLINGNHIMSGKYEPKDKIFIGCNMREFIAPTHFTPLPDQALKEFEEDLK